MKTTKALSKNAVPQFSVAFLQPKYWMTWLAILIITLYQKIPFFLKQKTSRYLGNKSYLRNKKRRIIAIENIAKCFPDWSEEKIEALAKKHFVNSVSIMFDMPRLWWGSKKNLQKNIVVEGLNSVALDENRNNIIFLTCHNLALEYGAIGLNFSLPIVGLVKRLENPLVDWLISRARTRFNIKLASKNDGIRPIVKAIKNKQAFYYLPDEDSVGQRTIESQFFASKKQTLPVLGKLSNLTQATIIPCYSFFDDANDRYVIRCLPKLILTNPKDEIQSALEMNQKLEELILIKPSQYMWTMRLFGGYSIDVLK